MWGPKNGGPSPLMRDSSISIYSNLRKVGLGTIKPTINWNGKLISRTKAYISSIALLLGKWILGKWSSIL